MWRLILEVIVLALIALFCLSAIRRASAQNWQDERHVWNEKKGRFEVENPASGRKMFGGDGDKKAKEFLGSPTKYTQEWARYLPRTVRYGKREATSWEISEAQRKLWAKGVIQQRAMQKAAQRRQLITHRKMSGWYDARYKQGISHGSGAYNLHMQSVGNRYGYY
jgi:hypothetical protein